MSKNPKYVDHLSEDPPIAGQKFTLMSFVGPKLPQKAEVLGMKIRGSYDDITTARNAAKALRERDPWFDVHIAPTGLWVPFNPDPEQIVEAQYQENALNQMVGNHKDELERNREVFMERKRQMVDKARWEASKEGQEYLANKKEHYISVKHRRINLENQIKNLQEQIEETEEKLKTFTPEEIEEAEREFEANKAKAAGEAPTQTVDNRKDVETIEPIPFEGREV